MGGTAALRDELRKTFLPFMEDKGFMLDDRDKAAAFTFRRINHESVQVCDIQWDKYGHPRFILSFGSAPLGAPIPGGAHLAPQDMYVWHMQDFVTLKPGRSATTRGWFRQDKPFFLGLHKPDAPVKALMQLFTEVEAYLQDKQVGPHLTVVRGAPE